VIDFAAIKGWVFDIDDTLMLERSYVASGFSAVSEWVRRVHGVDGFTDSAIALFDAGIRGNVFDLAMAELGVEVDKGIIASMVEVYRTHIPRVTLEPDAVRLIEKLKPYPMAVISDGPISSQSRKVRALGLRDFASPILLTDEWGKDYWKPHPRAFNTVETLWAMRDEALVYVADNPLKDFDAPKILGWQTIRISRPLGQHARRAGSNDRLSLAIETLDEILPYVG
jgi:putative hydrolase of the HAD superfamily